MDEKKKSRNRASEIQKCFSLVDQDGKGYITPEDILRLSQIDHAGAGRRSEMISIHEADAMLKQSKSSNNTDENRLYENEFRRILAPPSP